MTQGGRNLILGCKALIETPELTVAAGLARGLFDLAVSKGVDRRALVGRSAIRPQDLQDQDNRIPFAKYVALMRAGQELSKDAALALHYGETVDLSEISIVGMIGHASQTMIEAFAQIQRFGALVTEVDLGPGERFETKRASDGLWLIDRRINPNAFPELTETTFARMVCSCSRIIYRDREPGTPIVGAIHVTHKAPAYRAEYERIFRAPVTFESDRNAMLLDPAWIAYRMSDKSRYAFGVLSSHADALLRTLLKSKSTRARIESLLIPILHTGDIGIEAIAARLGVARWTLARRLKAEGATYERVLDELRQKMALHYLSGRKASVNETAYLVGFSELAAFSRAFKRWTGMSPRQFRLAAATKTEAIQHDYPARN